MFNLYFLHAVTTSMLETSVPKNREFFINLLKKYEKLTDFDILIDNDLINDLAVKDICLSLFVDPKQAIKQGDLLFIRAAVYNKVKNGVYWIE